jgi:hypothetical protein
MAAWSVAQTGIIRPRFWRREASVEPVLLGAILCASLLALAVLLLGLFQPILDEFPFRQTQTALTAFWLMRGGPILAYETPVVGFPWSIPNEFPVYQIIVAVLSETGVPLDAAGRIVSFAFFVGCLWPLNVLFRALRLGPFAFPSVAVLFLLSPLYLFWGRTFMVETCALFFCLAWLAWLAAYLREPKPAFAAIAVAAGCLGILAKSTTFPAFAVLGVLLLLKQWHSARKTGFSAVSLRPVLVAALVLAVPFLLGILWTVYSDMVKAQNEIGARLTSTALAPWTFGTWDQRIGARLWRDVIASRSLADAFGYGAVPALAAIAATLLRREYAYAAAAAVLAFLVPFVVFTNLHVVHGYYQAANAIFIVAAAGLGLACLMNVARGLGVICLALIAAGQLFYFHSAYAAQLTRDLTALPQFRVAQIARSLTPADAGLVILGDDWSSIVPYYAQRRALAVPKWMSAEFLRRVFASPQRFLGEAPLGAVVYCPDALPKDAERRDLIDAFVAGRKLLGEAGECRLFAPEKT